MNWKRSADWPPRVSGGMRNHLQCRFSTLWGAAQDCQAVISTCFGWSYQVMNMIMSSLESNEWLGADPISGHVLFFISSRRYFVFSGRIVSCDFSIHCVVSHILLYRSLLIWCWPAVKNLVWDAAPFPAPLCSPLSGVSCWEEAVGWKFALPGDRCLPVFKHKEQVA